MARHLYIGGVDRWSDLVKDSLQIEQVLTQTVDTCEFRIVGDPPAVGEEVQVVDDTLGLLFAGIVLPSGPELVDDKPLPVYHVRCGDYTELLDRKLVVETYENMTADAIVRDIITKYGGGLFTTNHVRTGAPTVEMLVFDYVKPSDALKEIADYCGWDYYIDYSKDVWFFNPADEASPAPMALEPGGYFRNLKHKIDDRQDIRNRVYVRGGTMLSDPWTYEIKADGSARAWVLPHRPHDLIVKVGGVTKTVGIENVDDEATKDFLMNYQEKCVRCSAQTPTPAQGTTLSFTYRYDIDVITMVEDIASQQAIAAVQGGDGVYEHSIVDDSLTTIDAAEAAGLADLREHANPRVKGSFETEVPGWSPGQLVTINLPDRGIQGTFLVQKVIITPCTPEKWTFKVEYGGRLLGIADWLQALWKAQQKKKLNETAVLHKFHYGAETTKMADELGPTIIHRTPPLVLPAPTFARSSVAYLSDGTQVPANTPRFETGRFGQAVMVEEGTTNLFTNPRLLNNGSGWTPSSTTTWVNSSGEYPYIHCEAQWDGVYQTLSLSATTYTLTYLVKHKTGSNVIGSHFDGSPTLIIRVDNGPWVSGNIITVPSDNNWHLVEIQATYSTAGNYKVYLQPGREVTGISEFYFKYAQIEAKPYATSFVDGTRSPETLTIPTAGVLNPQEGTIEFLFNLQTSPSLWASFVDIGTWTSPITKDWFSIYYGYGWGLNKLGFAIYNGTTGQSVSITATFPSDLQIGRWYYVAAKWVLPGYIKLIVYDTTTGQIYSTNANTTISAPTFANYPMIYIGSRYGGGYQINASIDDLRISSRARTDEEIAAAYQSGQPLPVDADTTYKLNFDNEIMDYVRTPLCGFVVCG